MAGSGDTGNGAQAAWRPGAALICDLHCACPSSDSGLQIRSGGCTAWHSSRSGGPLSLLDLGCWQACICVALALQPSWPVCLASALPAPLLGALVPSPLSLPTPRASVLDFPPSLTTVRDPRLADFWNTEASRSLLSPRLPRTFGPWTPAVPGASLRASIPGPLCLLPQQTLLLTSLEPTGGQVCSEGRGVPAPLWICAPSFPPLGNRELGLVECRLSV